MGPWLDSITGWLTLHPQWLGLAIVLVAATECLAIVGLIVPGTVLLFGIAVLAGGGALSLSQALLLGFLGGLIGDVLSYTVGRRFHQNIRRLPVLRNHPEWINRAEGYFQRYGIASLLVGRFIGPLRPMLPMVAGMFDMPVLRFIGVSLLAGAGWSVVYIMPGWATGAAMRLPLPDGFWPQAGIVAAAFAILIGLSVHASLRRLPRATQLIAALCLLLMAALFIGYPYLNHLDQGVMALVQEHRGPAADRFAVMLTRMGDFRAQLTLAGIVCALLLILRQWRPALFAVSTLLLTALGNGASKWFFARTRPEVLLTPLHSYSMPSGHSSASFAFFMTLAVLAGRGQPTRMRLTWLLLGGIPALFIAMSRVYLGAHWPTDIMAGALLACFMCAACLSVMQYKQPLPTMAPRVWAIILPVCLATLGYFAFKSIPHAMLRYQY
ncbi:MAG: bifunctional DedA family/phosphatase PAP2 family protein [Pseudomonas sp.]|uniref:bifunctional DedA family/phosphatase PAP2 family protein n=1 Tax=Pseudomonas abieticivorans TaxID=2931382 RepID=UPI0020BDED72|nr:bifunctional DedA family/phosphatase PAP2 family protein [Pseudomonas sp. PIA16]MDE1166755.1 bifunctional DedA family/phosphatase PAP2 family protein [Pseudomonas sp.]